MFPDGIAYLNIPVFKEAQQNKSLWKGDLSYGVGSSMPVMKVLKPEDMDVYKRLVVFRLGENNITKSFMKHQDLVDHAIRLLPPSVWILASGDQTGFAGMLQPCKVYWTRDKDEYDTFCRLYAQYCDLSENKDVCRQWLEYLYEKHPKLKPVTLG